MRRVLFLVSNPVDPDPRVMMEALSLSSAGFKVRILAMRRRGHERENKRVDGVEIIRRGLEAPYARPIGLGISLAAFYLSSLAERSHDVVHCHDLDTLPLGLLLGRRSKVIYDAHEYYGGMAFPGSPFMRNLVDAIEGALVPKVDAVVTVGKRLARRFKDMGAREVVVIGNWRDPMDPEGTEELRKSWGLDVNLIISYVGVLDPRRGILDLMKAVSRLDGVGLVIGGYKGAVEEVARFAEKHKNMKFLGKVDPDDVPRVFAASDAVFYVPEHTPNGYYSAPNSFFIALSVGRPVLTSDYGEIADLVRETGCGFIIEPTVEGIRRFLMGRGEELMDARASCLKSRWKYSWKEAERRLMELYGRLAP